MKHWTCRDEITELQYVDPWLMVVLADCILWATEHSLPLYVTSIIREYNDGISESTTHQEGRALDLGVEGWPLHRIHELSEYLNVKYSKKIGTSPEGKPPLVCKYHNNGNGWHFHLQVRRYIPVTLEIRLS